MPKILIIILIVWYLCLTVITYLLYGKDKVLAIEHRRRIPEKVLLGFGLAGGALGALTAMPRYHHKTRKYYFWLCNFLFLALHVCGIWGLHYLLTRS